MSASRLNTVELCFEQFQWQSRGGHTDGAKHFVAKSLTSFKGIKVLCIARVAYTSHHVTSFMAAWAGLPVTVLKSTKFGVQKVSPTVPV